VTTYLLDANVLIALTFPDHPAHDGAAQWFARIDSFALCPITEGALIRSIVRLRRSVSAAVETARRFHDAPGCQLWPDAVFYTDIDMGTVTGHKTVTDAYLLGLVAHHPGARLATFDRPLAAKAPGLTELVG
jgi:toxin-antitoxin system PIN domain toxin